MKCLRSVFMKSSVLTAVKLDESVPRRFEPAEFVLGYLDQKFGSLNRAARGGLPADAWARMSLPENSTARILICQI